MMPYKVLILDDDADFNSLLTDIFEQAAYAVTSIDDPEEAVETFRANDFDIVVSDYKMPGMTGCEFMSAIKVLRPEVPVIMVSGYLENDTIRDLIREGVGGVFLKPLNIFSLLERTAELVEESRRQGAQADGSEPASEAHAANLAFPFRSFPCKSEVSIAFAENLYRLRNFKSTLSICGGPGTHFYPVCEDLRTFDGDAAPPFVYLGRDNFDADEVLDIAGDISAAGAGRISFVISGIEQMSEAQKALAVALSRREAPFDAIDAETRQIFCLERDIDVLYDDGVIGEQLYILLGTAEATVPELRACPEDIPQLAQHAAEEAAGELGVDRAPRLDRSAREFCREQDWPGNYALLKAVMREAVAGAKGDVLNGPAIKAALKQVHKATLAEEIETELKLARSDYVSAVALLLKDDIEEVAAYFGIEAVALEGVVS